MAAGARAATDTSTHWATWPTRSCQNAGLLRASALDALERVLEPHERRVVDGQEVVQLRRELDRHAEADDAHEHGADEDRELADVARDAVDEGRIRPPCSTPSSDDPQRSLWYDSNPR